MAGSATPSKAHRKRLLQRLLAQALTYPEAWEDNPWGESPVAKVGKKIFVFVGSPEQPGISVKLPQSSGPVLTLPCATPTGYGLGRAGWVTIDLAGPDAPPVAVLREWIDESYRAVAPKTLVRRLDSD
jgi:predicted DNA-binding protein (MmcQ/YjbR family)